MNQSWKVVNQYSRKSEGNYERVSTAGADNDLSGEVIDGSTVDTFGSMGNGPGGNRTPWPGGSLVTGCSSFPFSLSLVGSVGTSKVGGTGKSHGRGTIAAGMIL